MCTNDPGTSFDTQTEDRDVEPVSKLFTRSVVWKFYSAIIQPAHVLILEIFRQNTEFFLHHVSDFLEELVRGVPSESLPLEHDGFSVNPVQFTISR